MLICGQCGQAPPAGWAVCPGDGCLDSFCLGHFVAAAAGPDVADVGPAAGGQALAPGLPAVVAGVPSPGAAVVLRGHALDLLEGGDWPAFDLVVTDPPYAFGGSGPEHAVSAAVAVVLREAARRLRAGGWFVVCCASSWRSVAYMVESVRGLCEPVRIGAWCKPAARSKVKAAGWGWGLVLAVVMRRGAKGRPLSAWPGLDHCAALPVVAGRRAQLPAAVAEWLVGPYAVPGGVFLDPFAGSGALVAAAAARGMAAIGFERSAE